MRAFTWVSLGCLALACGGTAFTSDANNNGGSSGDGATAGVLGRGGHHFGGSSSKAGTDTGGTDTAGTDTAGTTTGGTDVVGGANTGGTDVGGTDIGGSNSGGVSSGGSMTGGTNSGGVAQGGSGMTGGTGMTGGSGGGTSIDIVCPKNQPSEGHACKDGLLCTYGQDIRSMCRDIAKCSGGVWTVDKPNCTGLSGCGMITPGNSCDPAKSPPCQLDKQYCICNSCPGPVCMVDSGTWECAGSSGANCPEFAPNEGQACIGSRQCTYGSCLVDDHVTATCSNAVWSWTSDPCPQLQ